MESSEGEISHEVLEVTSQTEIDRKKSAMSLPLGQSKFLPTEIQTPQDGPDEQSGMENIFYSVMNMFFLYPHKIVGGH